MVSDVVQAEEGWAREQIVHYLVAMSRDRREDGRRGEELYIYCWVERVIILHLPAAGRRTSHTTSSPLHTHHLFRGRKLSYRFGESNISNLSDMVDFDMGWVDLDMGISPGWLVAVPNLSQLNPGFTDPSCASQSFTQLTGHFSTSIPTIDFSPILLTDSFDDAGVFNFSL